MSETNRLWSFWVVVTSAVEKTVGCTQFFLELCIRQEGGELGDVSVLETGGEQCFKGGHRFLQRLAWARQAKNWEEFFW